MTVTFPHLGSAWVALKTLFDKNGVPCAVPPLTSKRTLDLGVRYGPEWICLPYKVLLGNLIEGLEAGADTVVDVGGPGLCRLGNYAMLHEKVLRDLGYPFRMVIFNWQEEGIIALAKVIKSLLPPERSWRQVIGDVKFGLSQLVLMDDVERRVHYIRPREKTPGAASRIWRRTGDRVTLAHSPEALRRVRAEIMAELDAIPLDPSAQPLKIGLLGEFFMVLDSYCNLDIEEELGKRGVEVHRAAFIMQWAKSWLFLEMIGFSHDKKVKKAARPYLSRDVSGDAQQSLGETILHKADGFDGIVHLLPFTCMPEIIAQNIFPRLTKDHEIPVLSLTLDGQTGKAGLTTRVEAFVDLMQRRRARLAVS